MSHRLRVPSKLVCSATHTALPATHFVTKMPRSAGGTGVRHGFFARAAAAGGPRGGGLGRHGLGGRGQFHRLAGGRRHRLDPGIGQQLSAGAVLARTRVDQWQQGGHRRRQGGQGRGAARLHGHHALVDADLGPAEGTLHVQGRAQREDTQALGLRLQGQRQFFVGQVDGAAGADGASSVSTRNTRVCITPLVTAKSVAMQLRATGLSPISLVRTMLPTFRPISSSSSLLTEPWLIRVFSSPLEWASRVETELPTAESWASPSIWPTVACIFSMVGNSCLICRWRAVTLAVALMALTPSAPLPSRRMLDTMVPPARLKLRGSRVSTPAFMTIWVLTLLIGSCLSRTIWSAVNLTSASTFFQRSVRKVSTGKTLPEGWTGSTPRAALLALESAPTTGLRSARRNRWEVTAPVRMPRGLPLWNSSLPAMSLLPTLPLNCS